MYVINTIIIKNTKFIVCRKNYAWNLLMIFLIIFFKVIIKNINNYLNKIKIFFYCTCKNYAWKVLIKIFLIIIYYIDK